MKVRGLGLYHKQQWRFFRLPRTSESLIALHDRKHRYVGRKVGGMLDALVYMEWGRKHSEII